MGNFADDLGGGVDLERRVRLDMASIERGNPDRETVLPIREVANGD